MAKTEARASIPKVRLWPSIHADALPQNTNSHFRRSCSLDGTAAAALASEPSSGSCTVTPKSRIKNVACQGSLRAIADATRFDSATVSPPPPPLFCDLVVDPDATTRASPRRAPGRRDTTGDGVAVRGNHVAALLVQLPSTNSSTRLPRMQIIVFQVNVRVCTISLALPFYRSLECTIRQPRRRTSACLGHTS